MTKPAWDVPGGEEFIDDEYLNGDMVFPVFTKHGRWTTTRQPQEVYAAYRDKIMIRSAELFDLYGSRALDRMHLFRTFKEAEDECDRRNSDHRGGGESLSQ